MPVHYRSFIFFISRSSSFSGTFVYFVHSRWKRVPRLWSGFMVTITTTLGEKWATIVRLPDCFKLAMDTLPSIRINLTLRFVAYNQCFHLSIYSITFSLFIIKKSLDNKPFFYDERSKSKMNKFWKTLCSYGWVRTLMVLLDWWRILIWSCRPSLHVTKNRTTIIRYH